MGQYRYKKIVKLFVLIIVINFILQSNMPPICTASYEKTDITPPEAFIIEPKKGYIYVLGSAVMPISSEYTIMIGGVILFEWNFRWEMYLLVEVYVYDEESGVSHVEFYFDNILQSVAFHEPYAGELLHNTSAIWWHTVMIVAFDNEGNKKNDDITLWLLVINK